MGYNDGLGDKARKAIYKEWAESEMRQHAGGGSTWDWMKNQGLDGLAVVGDIGLANRMKSPYDRRYKIIEEQKKVHGKPNQEAVNGWSGLMSKGELDGK